MKNDILDYNSIYNIYTISKKLINQSNFLIILNIYKLTSYSSCNIAKLKFCKKSCESTIATLISNKHRSNFKFQIFIVISTRVNILLKIVII